MQDWNYVRSIEHNSTDETIPQMFLADAASGELKLKLILEDGVYAIPPDVRDIVLSYVDRLKRYMKSWRASGIYVHETNQQMKLSVRDLQFANGTITLKLQRLDYDDVLATHYQMDIRWRGLKSLRQHLLDLSPRLSLGGFESKGISLPNILGINVLVFTPSGNLILQTRSKHVAVRPLELCASGSGSVNVEDIREGQLVGISREPQEEIAIDPEKIRTDSIRFLGITRDLVSHGIVDCHYCAITDEALVEILSKNNLAKDREERTTVVHFEFGRDLVEGALNAHARVHFQRRLDELFRQYGQRISTPLKAGLKLWSIARLGND